MLLMCKRKKAPYIGLLNLVGGKIEPDEAGMHAAYRELWEETGISEADIRLTHMMDFTYHMYNCYVEVYVGRLKHSVVVQGDENDLFWSDLNHNFFDVNEYAGEGNIGHIIETIKRYSDKIFATK
jgi:8-oxo-dGTP diphosphatase